MILFNYIYSSFCSRVKIFLLSRFIPGESVFYSLHFSLVYFWATVCKTVRPMLSVRCLSCLSVTFVHCGQTVGQINMKLGTQVGLGLGHIVLDGDPAPPPQSGTAPTQFSAHICCGQMAAWIKMPLSIWQLQP